jgi:glutamyl-tRNA reductase
MKTNIDYCQDARPFFGREHALHRKWSAGDEVLEATLMVVGLNHRTAPVAVREQFWISENRRYEALVQLSRAEGIEEVIVMATCNRTESWLWADDVTLAANSVMRLLGAEYSSPRTQIS